MIEIVYFFLFELKVAKVLVFQFVFFISVSLIWSITLNWLQFKIAFFFYYIGISSKSVKSLEMKWKVGMNLMEHLPETI